MSRPPARETIAFALALATLAVGGGVAASTVASADAGTAPNASIDYDGERLNVDSAPEQVISGTSTVEEGSQVTVRVRSSDSSSPFLSQSVLNVSEGGDFAASFDFDDVEPGTKFAVSVHHNGTKLAEAPGVVGECDPTCGEDGGEARLAKTVVLTTQGETVDVGVSLENRETATIQIGGEESNVRVVAVVEDGDGDGQVVLEFATAVDDADDAGLSASSDADDVSVLESDRPSELDAGEYELAVWESSDGREGQADDIGSLAVHEGTDDPETTRNEDDETTTAGTIYETATTAVSESSGGFSLTTVGLLGLGGVLGVLGIVALVGGLD